LLICGDLRLLRLPSRRSTVKGGSMAGQWEAVVSEMIPLALVITLSPLSIIPAVLVLQGPRGKTAGLAYLVGWVAGLAALTAIFVGLSSLIGDFGHPPKWASWARIAIGVGLIVFGVWRWLTRHRTAHSPQWMRALSTATPRRAAATAALLCVVNPKVFFMCAAAGLAAGSEGLGIPGTWGSAVFFVLVASASVAAPVLAYAVSGDRLKEPLARLNEWMERQHAVLVAGILVVIGVLVLYKGIHGLA
jgi:threonine/homoserine/homoserine lactone efflux protein